MQDGLTELNLNNNFGLFITLNPRIHKMQNGNSGNDNDDDDGSSRLPAFLKSHFRTVACIEPDIELICAVSLYSDGFTQAKVSSQTYTIECHLNYYL